MLEDSSRFTSKKLELVSRILLISVKVLEVLFTKYKSNINGKALCYSECCTDFINCCVSSIQSYSTSKCVDQPDKSALFWIEVHFSEWRWILLNNKNTWGFLCFTLMWLFCVNLNESSKNIFNSFLKLK